MLVVRNRAGCAERDREILCVFFEATNKAKAGQIAAEYSRGTYCRRDEYEIRQDGWKVEDGRVSSQPMAEWYGVTTNAEGRVIGLNLNSKHLASKRRSDIISDLAQQPHSK